MRPSCRRWTVPAALLAAAALNACGSSVFGPSPSDRPGADGGLVHADGIDRVGTGAKPSSEGSETARVAALGRPAAVFRTTPSADDGATISGPSPLSVEFNLCRTRPASEDDDLKFTYDFDADGTVDLKGQCRATYVYENPNAARTCGPARVCVSDRRPASEVCQDYEVCVEGRAPDAPPPVTVPNVPEHEPNDDGTPDTGAGGPDPLTAGNDFDLAVANAQPAITETTFIRGRVDPAGDEDYFKITSTRPFRVSVEFALPSGESTCLGGLAGIVSRRADGSRLGGDFSNCPGAGVAGILPAGDTVFFGVMAQDDATTFDYIVRIFVRTF
jgi:hypothetical protein